MIEFVNAKVGPSPQAAIKISEWRVYFATPFGLFDCLSDAIERVRAAGDFDPEICIIPVPVAIGENGYREVVSR